MTKPISFSDKRQGITHTPLIYLASPYSDPDPAVMARRAACVIAVTARLLKEGKHVFSPIAYSHQFATEHGMGTDWETWKEFGTAMMNMFGRLAILRIPGWEQSEGLNAERWHAGQSGVFPNGTTYIDPTPEELAILDEPEEHGSRECKWHDPGADEEHACTKPHCIAQGNPECLSNAGLMSDCEYFEPKEESKPITQPEPKCKFWSDKPLGDERNPLGLCLRDRHACHVPGGVYSEGLVINGCQFAKPAEEPKTGTISLGEDGMKIEVDEPTAEEKIIEGLEGFADELESGRVVVHPCKWWDVDRAKCVTPNQEPDKDGCMMGECPRGDAGWVPDNCTYYEPGVFTIADRLDLLVAKARKAQSELSEAMAEIHELTRKGAE